MTDEKVEKMIKEVLKEKTRKDIVDYIDQFGDSINWDGWTTRQILEEVWRSDCEAGEEEDGILVSLYNS